MRPMLLLLLLLVVATPAAAEKRTVLSLDGIWRVAEAADASAVPTLFPAEVPVPGLVHLATPAFRDVDRYDSPEYIWSLVQDGKLDKSMLKHARGIARQGRSYFWYRRSFEAPARRGVARLRIGKAQFGTQLWLNGRKIGDHHPCFTSATFDVTDAIRWSGPNEVLVRVGAHPGVLPQGVTCGTDFEKRLWTPGIYDEVRLELSDPPIVERVQVAPQFSTCTVLVEAALYNPGAAGRFSVRQAVREWKTGRPFGKPLKARVALAAGERRVMRWTMPMSGARLWSPDDPFLYVHEVETPGDSVATRFGMREFRFDTPTRRAYLNGRPYFLRGSNIALHRFFEDPASRALPWTDAWVRRLLGELPRRLNWNSMRFTIGPVPNRWLDIADEVGMLVQNEYFIWADVPGAEAPAATRYRPEQVEAELRDWLRDSWNHPSIVTFDATNESWFPESTAILKRVRAADLSNRPWENSYNPPAGPDDPVEVHLYENYLVRKPGETWHDSLAVLERMPGEAPPALPPFLAGRRPAPTGHATIVNEYGWLWLTRKGEPTQLAVQDWIDILGAKATAADRLRWNAYLLAGLTEFWRAHRRHAGVQHFAYLAGCGPGAYTCDNFADVAALRLQPGFEEWVGGAFKPLGVYLSFWQPTLAPGTERMIPVMLVNDEDRPRAGEVELSLDDASGRSALSHRQRFKTGALGQTTLWFPLEVPDGLGSYTLRATARADGTADATTSRRWVKVQRAAVKQ